jgi:hypothetical protein
MSRVEPQRDRRAIGVSEAAERADDRELSSAELVGAPPHPDVLRKAEEVAAGRVAEHLRGERELTGGSLAGNPTRGEYVGTAEDSFDGREVHDVVILTKVTE